MKCNCTFTTNITDELDCDLRGNFDDYGFPMVRCKKFPCEVYKDHIKSLKLARLAYAIEKESDVSYKKEKE